jgi:hypothetical protein
MNQRTVLLGIVSLSILVIAPYVSVYSQPSLSSNKTKGFFDEVAEVAEKVGDIDEKAEDIKRASEEFIDDVKENEEE